MPIERVYHTWDKWECYPAGFYENNPPKGMTKDQAEDAYREFLSDLPEFRRILSLVISEWKNSCDHYLTNENMNRIAWLGQACLAYKYRIPSCCRGGYHRLSPEQQVAADQAALDALNEWLAARGEETHTLESVQSRTQANLY